MPPNEAMSEGPSQVQSRRSLIKMDGPGWFNRTDLKLTTQSELGGLMTNDGLQKTAPYRPRSFTLVEMTDRISQLVILCVSHAILNDKYVHCILSRINL